ncbi:hypothetical protein [Limosilactobacillus mucosae]|nr:hypothetical protein [Limosilactobacillus mucosae]
MCRFSSPNRFKYDLQSDVVFNVKLTVTTDCHDNDASTCRLSISYSRT